MQISKTLVASLILSAGLSHAGAIVFDNGGPSTDNGYYIENTSTTADDFNIAGGATIGSVGFFFQNYNGITGWNLDINYSILSDAGGPGSVLASGSGLNVVAVDSGLPWCCVGGNAYLVTFDLQSPFVAAPGTTYWLQLGGATGADNAWWVTADSNGTATGWSNGSDVGYQFAFFLSDTETSAVPEPSTFLLVGMGAGALGLFRRKRRA